MNSSLLILWALPGKVVDWSVAWNFTANCCKRSEWRHGLLEVMSTLTAVVLLRSEIPSGMCAKLRTVAASNNRDHARNLSSRTLVIKFNRSHVNIGRATTSQSLLLLLARATHMMVLFFPHIPFVVNHTFNATPPERLQQYCTKHLHAQPDSSRKEPPTPEVWKYFFHK